MPPAHTAPHWASPSLRGGSVFPRRARRPRRAATRDVFSKTVSFVAPKEMVVGLPHRTRFAGLRRWPLIFITTAEMNSACEILRFAPNLRAKPVPAVRVPKALGTMLILPASICGAEVLRIASASVPAQPLTLALVVVPCFPSAAPAWVLPFKSAHQVTASTRVRRVPWYAQHRNIVQGAAAKTKLPEYRCYPTPVIDHRHHGYVSRPP